MKRIVQQVSNKYYSITFLHITKLPKKSTRMLSNIRHNFFVNRFICNALGEITLHQRNVLKDGWLNVFGKIMLTD